MVELEDRQTAIYVFGQQQEHLRFLQKQLGVEIHVRDRRLTLRAPSDGKLQFARLVIVQLCELAERGYHLMLDDIIRSVRILENSPGVRLVDIFLDTVLKTDYGRPIAPKGPAQKLYIDAIRKYDIVFGVGPAGTGKTYLAMAMALDAFLKKRVQRIILTRPAVEAGERLGFLPGDLAEKVNPYLRPLNDALNDMLDRDKAHQLLERGHIEVAPLAFMRGRTLNSSFVILDEAQNSTREQMKMFLTRLGFDTKAVITGDITQIDLPDNKSSGLVHAAKILKDIQGIKMCTFSDLDVVRHPLVAEIIKAYDRDDKLAQT
ncbi:MAG: PhoH family protein [Bradymonadales bacterium]|nr:PhoH family protein [Bradymonadales bacterium]